MIPITTRAIAAWMRYRNAPRLAAYLAPPVDDVISRLRRAPTSRPASESAPVSPVAGASRTLARRPERGPGPLAVAASPHGRESLGRLPATPMLADGLAGSQGPGRSSLERSFALTHGPAVTAVGQHPTTHGRPTRPAGSRNAPRLPAPHFAADGSGTANGLGPGAGATAPGRPFHEEPE